MNSSNENDDAKKAKYEADKAKYEADKAKYEADKAEHEADKAKYGFLKKPVARVTELLVQVLLPASDFALDKLVELYELLRAWFLG